MSAHKPQSISRTHDDLVLLERYRDSRDSAARSELLDRFMPLASSLIRRQAEGQRALAELEQIAALGLIKAVERFDAASGRRFEPYAVRMMEVELERHAYRRDDTLDDYADAGPGIERADDRMLLCGLLRTLGPAERVIVRLRVVDEMTHAEIAAVVGLDSVHVSRVLRRAVSRMHDVALAQEVASG